LRLCRGVVGLPCCRAAVPPCRRAAVLLSRRATALLAARLPCGCDAPALEH
jgi:hypothetical protein